MLPPVVTIDFETHGIRPRPQYPPKPVGVAIKYGDKPGKYWAWGHPTGNNCTEAEAKLELTRIWLSGAGLLFFNAKFDLAVATEQMGLPMPHWSRIHDAAVLHYLSDPHAKVADLKRVSEQLLDWPAAERDELNEWIWASRKVLSETYGRPVSKAKKGSNGLGSWIWATPGEMCGRYAVGDVDRTYGLWELLYPVVRDWGMLAAYDRERHCLPIFMENERVGIRVDLPLLQADIATYEKAFEYAESWLRWRLCAEGLSFDNDVDVAAALSAAGIVEDSSWVETAGGDKSMSKENLKPSMFTDPQVCQMLGYRNRLATALKMFMQPWRDQAVARGVPYISTNWNLTRNPKGGTRTGRPSTNDPNLLNISKDFEGRPDGYIHPEWSGLPKLPLVRKYIVPDEGHVFLHRDFNGQELRVFAHFECGKLHAAYLADPRIDVHQLIADDIKKLSPTTQLDRTKTKIINFRTIYGSGVPGLSKALDCDIPTARAFKAVHTKAMPGMKDLNDEIARVIKRGEPIRTWGDRIYFVEPSGFSKKHKKMMDYLYKLLNYLVQGSAADLTKESIICWYEHPRRDPRTRFLVTVYDEINISCPAEIREEQMEVLRECMEIDRVSVPMLSDGKYGDRWGDLKKCA